MIATAFEGFKRVWPEMPDRVAAEADNRMRAFDLLGALSVVRDWEMQVRGELTRRWLSVPVISAGGMALTAEQVEDVRTVAFTKSGSDTYLLAGETVDRLRALFPATEPAEDRLDIGTADAENLDGWEGSTPAEPAEEVTQAEGFCSFCGWSRDACARGEGDCAPAEPAEEETKAKGDHTAYSEAVSLSYWLAKQLGEHVDDASHRGETLTDTVQRLIEHIRPNLGKTTPASSPVVPAPTETGPWEDISQAPKHLTLRDKDGNKWTHNSINWASSAIIQYAPVESINRHFAPFVADKEG